MLSRRGFYHNTGASSTAHSDPDFYSKYHNGKKNVRVTTEFHGSIVHATWCLCNENLHGDTPDKQAHQKIDKVPKNVHMEYTKVFSYSTKVHIGDFSTYISMRESGNLASNLLQAWCMVNDAEKM